MGWSPSSVHNFFRTNYLANLMINTCSEIILLYPSWINIRGQDRNHSVYPSLSVQVSVRPTTFVLVWHWLIIFGTRVYHHGKVWHVHSYFRSDSDFWPQGQIYRPLSCLHVRPEISLSFDIGILYLTHGPITMRGYVKYIRDPDRTLTIDLNVKFIGFMTGLCVQVSAFLSHDIVILCLAREFITIIRRVAYIHELCMTFDMNIKIIFSPWIWIWQDVFALWHRHTKFWHMAVSPWDNTLCTFLTLVWPWTLTFKWVAEDILGEFYLQFLSCF